MNRKDLSEITVIEHKLGYEIKAKCRNKISGYVFMKIPTLQILSDLKGNIFYFETKGMASSWLNKKFQQHNLLEEYAESKKDNKYLNGSFFKQIHTSNIGIAIVRISNK